MPTGIDPRFDDYKPQEEVRLCKCCENEPATQLWETIIGKLWMCDWCVNSPDNDDGFLIEEIK